MENKNNNDNSNNENWFKRRLDGVINKLKINKWVRYFLISCCIRIVKWKINFCVKKGNGILNV